MTWQPIETAPRDGTCFLGGLLVNHWTSARDSYTTYFEVHVVFCDEETGEISSDCDCDGWSIDDYTHWQPLPPPPEPTK